MGNQQSKLGSQELQLLKNETQFSNGEIKSWHKGFLRDLPRPYLTLVEFIEIHQQFYPFGDPTKFSQLAFKVFDKDRDGKVDFAEFLKVLSICARGKAGDSGEIGWQLLCCAPSIKDETDGNNSSATKSQYEYVLKAVYEMMGVEPTIEELQGKIDKVWGDRITMNKEQYLETQPTLTNFSGLI
ncbi:frequenin [Martiniozyma asiatica (nom. inval.)]|nr:frequenin [Martiniozyma asiatica]